MKVDKVVFKHTFTPFQLTLTVQSPGEAKALFAIFSHDKNVELVGKEAAKRITGLIGDNYGTTVLSEMIANGVLHRDYFL